MTSVRGGSLRNLQVTRWSSSGGGNDLRVLKIRRPLHGLLTDRPALRISLEAPRKRPGGMNSAFVVRNPRCTCIAGPSNQTGSLHVSQGLTGAEVNDSDKNGFMATIHELDRSKGLDLLLHTPGGNVAATESLVHYLRAMFGTDTRVIVPQLAMSPGTMIALSAKAVVMGKHSSLGPIDPQIMGMPAHALVAEFTNAAEEIRKDPSAIPVWQPILAKYPPTLIGESQKAIVWAEQMVREWLATGMFAGEDDAEEKAAAVVSELASHELTLSHDRHIPAEKAKEIGISVETLESDDDLQEAVLSVHHACI